MTKKILHVCTLDKFIPPFIDFVEDNFGLDDQFFWLNGDFERYPVKQKMSNYKVKRTRNGKIKGYLKLVQLMHGSDRILLHGLFDFRIVLILFFMPWLLKKCYWVMWGGDLYCYKLGELNWKWKVKEFIRRPVIKNMGGLVTYIPGDAKLARQWYGAKGKYHECLMYPSNVVDPKIIESEQDQLEEHSVLNILVGNSADPSNNHIEVFEKLLPYKHENINIFAPLSYGDPEHVKKVIEKGNEWFGSKFTPITSFMASYEYLRFLKSIDIAIFNHKRQQAMGNTITLLGMGKTLFMRTDVSHYALLKELKLNLKNFSDFDLNLLDKKASCDNEKIIRLYFSEKKLKNQLIYIFEG